MSIEHLLETNKYLKSISEIDNLKDGILDELQLSSDNKRSYKKQLKDYLFVNEIDDLKTGTFLRCIKMEDDSYSLTPPCIFCDIKMTENGMLLLCKQIWNQKVFFHLHMDKIILFRKLKSEEKLILLALQKHK
jgi:hypothetical protein